MKRVTFTCHGHSSPAYSCNLPNDQSGAYFSEKDVFKAISKAIDDDPDYIIGNLSDVFGIDFRDMMESNNAK